MNDNEVLALRSEIRQMIIDEGFSIPEKDMDIVVNKLSSIVIRKFMEIYREAFHNGRSYQKNARTFEASSGNELPPVD